MTGRSGRSMHRPARLGASDARRRLPTERDPPIGPEAIIRLLILPALALLLVFAANVADAAEPTFPPLTGRVVDAAGVLSPEAKARLEQKLKAYEDKTSDQVVVATVPNLQGYPIEDYANRLFRAWKLGDKQKNNGALLVVAPSERKVRIEVGYGLEGGLTDALAKTIITSAIVPRFRQGDVGGGIEAGADAIVSILAGDAEEWHRKAEVRGDEVDGAQIIIWLIIFLFLLFVIWRMNAQSSRLGSSSRRRRGDGGFIIVPGPSGGGWSGGFSDGGFGGGFSGGGGSSGGGGASGDW